MKPYDILLNMIRERNWGMASLAFERMVAFLSGGEPLSSADLTLFHQSAESAQAAASRLFGMPSVNTRYTSTQGDVGFLFLSGPIVPRADMITDISGMSAIDRLTVEFKALEADPTIRTIGVIVDSPGGDILGVEDLAYTISQSSKPVHVYAWMIASAAYWIGSAADSISIPASGIAGSIGVIMTLFRPKADANTFDIISTQSPKKNLDPTTDEGRAERQTIVDALASVMISNIATYRSTTVETVMSKFGQGGVFVGSAAADAGLVDYIRTADEFFAALRTDSTTLKGPSAGPERTRLMSGQAKNTPLVNEVLPAPAAIAADNTTGGTVPAAPVVAAVVGADAADARIKRIQAIEALEGRFVNAHPTVQAEVRRVINAEKYKPEATVGSVSELLLGVAASAQVAAVDAYAGGLRDAAAVAGALSGADDQLIAGGSGGIDAGRVSSLVEARKRGFRAKGLTVNG